LPKFFPLFHRDLFLQGYSMKQLTSAERMPQQLLQAPQKALGLAGNVGVFAIELMQGSSFAPEYPSVGEAGKLCQVRRRDKFDELRMSFDKADETTGRNESAAILAMPARRPLALTYTLIAALALVFAAEIAFPVEPASGFLEPSIRTLSAFGALDKRVVLEGGEWQRLFSAPLLHGSAAHLALNSLALFFAGLILENVIGRAWFAAIFAGSGLAGALMSIAINPASVVSVGASGAIMGLFAAALALSFRYPKDAPMRRHLLSGSLRVLIPSMLPLASGVFGEAIDFAAHAGGAIGGGALGGILAAAWRNDAASPPYRKAAALITAVGLCGATVASFKIATDHEAYMLAPYLIPPDRVPNGTAAWREKAADLAQAYPRDPRSHMYIAMAFGETGDKDGAVREWRVALGEGAMLRIFFKPELERLIRANLATTLRDNGKLVEAQDSARPLCAAEEGFRSEFPDLCP
jgi:rhomboid protease GluP